MHKRLEGVKLIISAYNKIIKIKMLDETTYKLSVSHDRRKVENINRKITDYCLNKIIGTGTFGKVFLATLGEKPFAVKVLRKRKIIELN